MGRPERGVVRKADSSLHSQWQVRDSFLSTRPRLCEEIILREGFSCIG